MSGKTKAISMLVLGVLALGAGGRAIVALSLLFLLVSVPGPAAADDSDESSSSISIRSAYDVCVSGGGRTTAEVLSCAHQEFVFQDERLNDIYERLMSRFDVAEKTTLRNDQRKWLADKKRLCALNEDSGTIDQMISADCGVRETASRAMELKKQLRKQ